MSQNQCTAVFARWCHLCSWYSGHVLWFLGLPTLPLSNHNFTNGIGSYRLHPLPNSSASRALVVLWRSSYLAPSNRRHHTSPSLFPFLYWLLLLARDVDTNPGPIKYPCVVCCKLVKSSQRGIYCDACYSCLHTRCISMSSEEYSELQHSNQPWCCKRCQEEALPYRYVSNSDSIFNTSNSASVFNTSAHHHSTSMPQFLPAGAHELLKVASSRSTWAVEGG